MSQSSSVIIDTIRILFKEKLNQGIIPDINSLIQTILIKEDLPHLPSADFAEINVWYSQVVELEFLQFIDNPSIDEIIYHGPNEIQVCQSGEYIHYHCNRLSNLDFNMALEILACRFGQEWNLLIPFKSFFAKIKNHKFRITILHHSLGPNSISKLFIRRQASLKVATSLESFCTENQKNILTQLVLDRKNIIIAGATGSGKTTLLRSLAFQIPKDEHVVVVEDTHEIPATNPSITHLVSEGANQNMANFLSWAMRISPHRILLGEIRSREINPFLLALNTGHKGLMATIHSNSAHESINRLALLYTLFGEGQTPPWTTIMQLLCLGIEYVVYLEKRKIVEIIKIIGHDGSRVLWEVVGEESNFTGPDILPLRYQV